MDSSKLILVISLICISLNLSAEVIYFQPYEGLPDYQKHSPFTETDKSIHKRLNTLIQAIQSSKIECEIGQVGSDTSFPLKLYSNICKSKDVVSIRNYVKKVAPTLELNNISLWKEDLDEDGLPELIVGYVDVSKTKYFQYPYLSLWIMKYLNGLYKTTYAGTYLAGKIHKVEYFGDNRDSKTIFVEHQSCIECEPWIYLTPVELTKKGVVDAYQFTYSDDHKSFTSTIEYILPGMGHSVDAKVTTRIPEATKIGPHLMQRYDIEQGPKEWWIFTCKDMKCDYKLFLKKLPIQYEKQWNQGKQL